MAAQSHRLNLLVAFFFPLATLVAVLIVACARSASARLPWNDSCQMRLCEVALTTLTDTFPEPYKRQ
jgi:hypothetical protein